MEDVLEVYEKPLSTQEPVVCLDEKPVTLHNDVRASLPMRPGSVAKGDTEYKRCGTANRGGDNKTYADRYRLLNQPDDLLNSKARLAENRSECASI